MIPPNLSMIPGFGHSEVTIICPDVSHIVNPPYNQPTSVMVNISQRKITMDHPIISPLDHH